MPVLKVTLLGLLFTFLWSTAAIATKIGIRSTTPLIFVTIRFLIAGGLLAMYTYVLKKGNYRLPHRDEWGPLVLIGLLNTTIYLGVTTWALLYTTAGMFNLFVTINPFVVALLSFLFLQRRIRRQEWIGMTCAAIGMLIAVWPDLTAIGFSLIGVIVLGFGMLSMAVGSVYLKKTNLQLPNIVLNTWQLTIGGLFLVPLSGLLEQRTFFIHYRLSLFGAWFWLIFVLSIGTMILWFYLLKRDPVVANNWLFMTPIFGYLLSALVLKEPVTFFDLTGTVFVVGGLFLSGNIKFTYKKKLYRE